MLAIDIGNSTICFKDFEDGGETFSLNLVSMWSQHISDLLEAGPEHVCVSSVVEGATMKLKELLKQSAVDSITYLTDHRENIIPHSLDNIETVGVDRLLAARAAKNITGSPIIVVQAGSAITIDLVDENGNFSGGYILPGPKLWLKGLAVASGIPDFSSFDNHADISIGTDTQGACVNGMWAALPAAICGAISNMPEAKIIMTGGWAGELAPRLTEYKIEVRKDLVLLGINDYYQNEIAEK